MPHGQATDGNDIQAEGSITPLIRQELPDTITRKSGVGLATGSSLASGSESPFPSERRYYRVLSISPDGKVLTLNPDRDGDGNADDLNQLTNDASDRRHQSTAVG